jgi:hypothetical protein
LAELQKALELSAKIANAETARSDNGAKIAKMEEHRNERSIDSLAGGKPELEKPVDEAKEQLVCRVREVHSDPVPSNSKNELALTSKVQDVVTLSIPQSTGIALRQRRRDRVNLLFSF